MSTFKSLKALFPQNSSMLRIDFSSASIHLLDLLFHPRNWNFYHSEKAKINICTCHYRWRWKCIIALILFLLLWILGYFLVLPISFIWLQEDQWKKTQTLPKLVSITSLSSKAQEINNHFYFNPIFPRLGQHFLCNCTLPLEGGGGG